MASKNIEAEAPVAVAEDTEVAAAVAEAEAIVEPKAKKRRTPQDRLGGHLFRLRVVMTVSVPYDEYVKLTGNPEATYTQVRAAVQDAAKAGAETVPAATVTAHPSNDFDRTSEI